MATVTHSLRVGSSIADYLVIGVVGRGPAGTVYLADHPSLRVPAALKVLSPELAGSAEFRDRFLQDCRIAAGIEQAAVIPILEADRYDGTLYVARKHVDGIDLATMLSSGPLSCEEAWPILEAVAGALDAAHREGLVHRDLTPSNILVETTSHRVYVTDFGMAPSDMDFAAPEQALTSRVDHRADVYSLGRVLVACLAEIPRGLQPVVTKALARETADRYSTAGEFAEACRERLAPPRKPPPVAEAHAVERTPARSRGRRRYVVVAATATIAVLGAVAGLALTRDGNHRSAPPAVPSPSLRPLIAARLRDRLVPRQRTLTDRVRAATRGSLKGIETAALAVGAEVRSTQGWVASLHPTTAADHAVTDALVPALTAQAGYAASLANLAPATSITKAEANATLAAAARAQSAYRRLGLVAPHLPLMPLRRDDQARLLTLTAGTLYDAVAFTQGEGVRYRNSPAQWCGGAPQTDPCWKSVVPGAGAAEGHWLRVYCYAEGAAVHGNPWWAEVQQTPAQYVPATFLRKGHGEAPANAPPC